MKKFEYFSDGCAGQYKNFKNLSNLTFHEADFGIKAKWTFFATSHGKSACDGIGGTVKRLTKRASLQRPYGNFILTVEAMLDFCIENIPNINFVHIGKTDMVDVRKKLEARFQIGRTIPGTRSFHHFEPFGPYTVCYKRTSDSKDFAATFNISGGGNQLILLKDLQANEYIACHYEKQWWIGIIEEVSSEEQDVLVNFLHPPGPARNFLWPKRPDTCWIPVTDVITKLQIPSTATGRTYQITNDEFPEITAAFSKI